jgi:RNA polymerase sigma-70 factor (ECF subfamily)
VSRLFVHHPQQSEFERIAMPHAQSLLRVARRMTSSPVAAEDLVQETLLAAWRNFHQFQPDSNIRAWLFRFLLNNFYAQGRKLRAVPPMVPLTPGSQTVFPVLDDAMEVSRALESLEIEHRTVLLLGVVEGFTCREIAGILEVPIGTVMSRLSRARQAMRTRLGARSPGVAFAATGNLTKAI